MSHVFRFFAEGNGVPGGRLELLREEDAHVRVLRLSEGDPVEVVDAAGRLWSATLAAGGGALLDVVLQERELLPDITLYAGLGASQAWDALVDGAVQTGVARIVPVVASPRAADKAAKRLERSARVARAAAKQAKRLCLPTIAPPVALADLAKVGAEAPRVVLATGSPVTLASWAVTVPLPGGRPISILVGASDGLPDDLVEQLVAAGWTRCGLGPTVLRSELAAAVAVAILAQSTHDHRVQR